MPSICHFGNSCIGNIGRRQSFHADKGKSSPDSWWPAWLPPPGPWYFPTHPKRFHKMSALVEDSSWSGCNKMRTRQLQHHSWEGIKANVLCFHYSEGPLLLQWQFQLLCIPLVSEVKSTKISDTGSQISHFQRIPTQKGQLHSQTFSTITYHKSLLTPSVMLCVMQSLAAAIKKPDVGEWVCLVVFACWVLTSLLEARYQICKPVWHQWIGHPECRIRYTLPTVHSGYGLWRMLCGLSTGSSARATEGGLSG